MIDDVSATQTTGALPELTHRERRRAVADGGEQAPGRYLALEHRGELVHLALGKDITRIGRGISCDVTVEDPSVSRRHALIVERDGAHVVLDDRSRNGTFLNGERVTEAVLSDGDVILVGPVPIRFVDRPPHA